MVCGLGSGFPLRSLALVDSEFAKEQLVLMLREWYMHEWATAGIRMGVRRRESASARVGQLACV